MFNLREIVNTKDTTPIVYGAAHPMPADLTADEAENLLRLLGDGSIAADESGALRKVLSWAPNTAMLRATSRAAEAVCSRVVSTLIRGEDTLAADEREALAKMNDRLVSAIVRFTSLLRTLPPEGGRGSKNPNGN
jgi:hypothetical protein